MHHNLQKAVQQIKSSGLRSWIAVNLDSRFTTIQPGRKGQASILRAFNDAFNSVNSALGPFVAHPLVLGVMLYGYTGQWTKGPKKTRLPQFASSSPFRWHGWVTDPGEELLYKDFVEAWHRRLMSRFDRMALGQLECS